MRKSQKTLIKIAAIAICALGFNASAEEICVTVAGPGGHSSGNYGNTSAVHAASRAIMQIHAAVPGATVVDFKGGSTVNAIAADATFKVRLSGSAEKQQKDTELVKMAVSKGCAEENSFRNVKEGELENGLRKDIRCTIK